MSLSALLAKADAQDDVQIPEYIIEAPAEVRRRLRALKKLHLESVDVQTAFYSRVHELEVEFREQFNALNAKRRAIVSGEHEPADAECNEKLFYWQSDEQAKDFDDNAPVIANDKPKGIPNFWLKVLDSHALFQTVTPDDEPVLKHLADITVQQSISPPSFTLQFHFSPNEFFTNETLTKFYKMSIGPNQVEEKVLYDGPSIIATEGCEINWKEGKNLTQKVKKMKKHGRVVTKLIKTESFFSFFSPTTKEISEDMPPEEAEAINQDFELGQFLRDNVIDSAVVYYTEEVNEDDDQFDFGGEDGEDGGSSDEDEEEE